ARQLRAAAKPCSSGDRPEFLGRCRPEEYVAPLLVHLGEDFAGVGTQESAVRRGGSRLNRSFFAFTFRARAGSFLAACVIARCSVFWISTWLGLSVCGFF